MPALTATPRDWPRAADPQAAARLAERYAEIGRAEARFAAGETGAALLRCLGGNSPYLSELALREPDCLRRTLLHGPSAVVARTMARLAAIRPTLARQHLAASLRQAKRQVALVTAVADIGGLWSVAQVTRALSNLADAALTLSCAHLLRAAHDAGELRLPDRRDPARGSGFTVLGMGKLGARELNYSSDVDLVLLHDPDSGVYHGTQAGAFYSRLAHGLVALMQTRDADGYVFRTDLRLRPDPAATPPCMALPGAIAYYESMGQNWERAAMLKARPVAGDLALGASFLEAIRPFIWRRHLDFAAIADIRAMKRRIDAHKDTLLASGGDKVARILGHNVKLGQGGIREIEFLAQTMQLVWGGRDPTLREPRTQEALTLLVHAGHLQHRTAAELRAAYRFLRRVEHRLQMVDDRQTHTLPDRSEPMERFALFMGYPDAGAFATVLLRHLGRVQQRWRESFEAVPEIAVGDAPALDFRGNQQLPPATIAALRQMGFTDPNPVVAAVLGWQAGRVRALRSPRSRELMESMLPRLLQALGRQPQPDAVFARFDAFLNRLPAGVQLLSLFQRNPSLLDRVAAVLGAAPSLAEHLARIPTALDGLLAPDEPGDMVRHLGARLAEARDLEEAIAIIRTAVREEDFRISVATMEGRIDADAAGAARADMADAALGALLPRVLDDFASRFGRVKGGALAVVLLGKAGGREMMAGSDLDLLLVYDHVPGATESIVQAGQRSLAASQWFIRAVHAYVAALTAPDAEGPMFAVDMRLRPSGNKGPVAVSLAAFERYHAAGPDQHGAWTWERMALTRARVVAGPARLRARVAAAIRTALHSAGTPARVLADAAAMRARLARDLPQAGPWDVKFRPGGQIEVEFIAQALLLAHGAEHPGLAGPSTRAALAALEAAGLLRPGDAALLVRADRAWRTVQGMLRITAGRSRAALAAETLPEASAQALLRACAAIAAPGEAAPVDLPDLRATLDTIAQQVHAAFVRYVGEARP
jgi:[glutamine synthetase] adenylyltransferase / [glutamine synthetase]-adenylyl-L-tyrosine phosphorylase